jgi:oligopeptidase A
MSFDEVTTLFHEFGHGLQHMLTRVDEGLASGIRNVEWDAVELPSQFMENFCYDRATIREVSGHVDTGEPLPDALFEKLDAARTYRAGSDMLRQIYFASTDLALHDEYVPGGDESPFDVQRRIAERTTVIPPLPEDRFLCSFGHIFAGGYAAGYYSYKWAEVLSADAFAAFEEAGLDDERALAATGRRYRDTVLALGGSVAPARVFEAFRGRPPSVEALLRHAGLEAKAAA